MYSCSCVCTGTGKFRCVYISYMSIEVKGQHQVFSSNDFLFFLRPDLSLDSEFTNFLSFYGQANKIDEYAYPASPVFCKGNNYLNKLLS